MSVVLSKILWYGSKGIANPIEITDYTSITVKKGLDAKGNTFDITLLNPIDSYDGTNVIHKHINPTTFDIKIKKDDVIEVYAKHADDQADITTADDYLLTIADVVDTEVILDAKKSQIKLTCMDKTFNLLNKIWTQSYTISQGFTAPQIIQKIIRSVCETDESGAREGYDTSGNLVAGGMYEIDARLESEGGYIEDARPDDSVFPAVPIGKLFKPIYEWIDELSQPEMTNTPTENTNENGPCKLKFIFYVDRLNKFHWQYPSSSTSPSYTFVFGEVNSTSDLFSLKLKNTVFDVVNCVFYNAGKSIENSGIIGYYFDKSTSESKLKIKYKPYTQVATELRRTEIAKGNITVAEDGIVTVVTTSPPRSVSWSDTLTYTTAADYKDLFFNECDARAKTLAKAFTAKRGSPRWKGSMTVKGINVTAGETINLTALPVGIDNLFIRIIDVTHQIDKNSWLTTLDLEEDEKEVYK